MALLITMNDYYKTLEMKENASGDEIKRSYRTLARKYHPDRNSSKNAETKFKEIQEAYKILSDPNARKEYDLSHHSRQKNNEQKTKEPQNDQSVKKQKRKINKFEIFIVGILVLMYLIRFSHKS